MRLLVVVSLMVATLAVAQQQPCALLPETMTLETPDGPQGLNVWVSAGGARPRLLQVDTGSTGIVLWRNHIGRDFTLAAPGQFTPPFVYYNSSRKAFCGQWGFTPVTISDYRGTSFEIPSMPVLAVDFMCIGQDPAHACECEDPVTVLPDLGMLGVGFDRGFSMGGPAQNPFLHHPDMDAGSMQRGYIITTEGIELGMASADVAGFRFVQLDRIEGQMNGWQQARGCVSIAGGGVSGPGTPVCGDVLMDTGVDRMFLTYATASLPAFEPPLPPQGGQLWNCCGPRPAGSTCPPNTCQTLRSPPATVTVTWPDAGPPVFTYAVTAPKTFDARQPAPRFAFVHGAELPASEGNVFVNTSRQLLYTADYLYDATCGRIGFRPNASRGGTPRK